MWTGKEMPSAVHLCDLAGSVVVSGNGNEDIAKHLLWPCSCGNSSHCEKFRTPLLNNLTRGDASGGHAHLRCCPRHNGQLATPFRRPTAQVIVEDVIAVVLPHQFFRQAAN